MRKKHALYKCVFLHSGVFACLYVCVLTSALHDCAQVKVRYPCWMLHRISTQKSVYSTRMMLGWVGLMGKQRLFFHTCHSVCGENCTDSRKFCWTPLCITVLSPPHHRPDSVFVILTPPPPPPRSNSTALASRSLLLHQRSRIASYRCKRARGWMC